jgi:hypothetical protein
MVCTYPQKKNYGVEKNIILHLKSYAGEGKIILWRKVRERRTPAPTRPQASPSKVANLSRTQPPS